MGFSNLAARAIGPAILAAALCSTTALANGRFPRALRLVEDPNDANHLVLAATFGLLVTSDRGRNWYHVCESAFSLQDTYSGDPLVSLLPNGSMLAGVQTSFNLSGDKGCGWRSTLSRPKQAVVDYTVAPSNPNLVVALVSSFEDGSVQNSIEESIDGGGTWRSIGAALPVAQVYTIDVEPVDPSHILVTGLSGENTGVFLRSTDHAATWSVSPIPNTNQDEIPFIAAVHPTDPEKIFVRTDAWTNRDIVDVGNDALLYSSDSGRTWRTILRPQGETAGGVTAGAKLFGFALSPDGRTVLAGYGDPIEGAQIVVTEVMGIYVASLADLSFTRVFDKSITCLAWTRTGLYACASSADSDFELGVAKDADLNTCPLSPILRLSDVRGSLPACPAVSAACDFSTQCTNFGACPGTARPDAASPALPAACMVTAGGADGGGHGGSAGGGGIVDASSAPPGASKDGGGCAVARRGATGMGPRFGLAAVFVALGTWCRRRWGRRTATLGS